MNRVITACASAFLGAGLAAGQLYEAVYDESASWIQTSDTTLQPLNNWLLQVTLTPHVSGVSSVEFNGSPMFYSALSGSWSWNSVSYPSVSDLDINYPRNVSYIITIRIGTSTPDMYSMVPTVTLPAPPPLFSAGSYDRLQNANPNQSILLSTAGFNAGNAPNSRIYFDLYDFTQSEFVFHSEQYGHLAATFTIPAGTMKPGSPYYAQLTYLTFVQTAGWFSPTIGWTYRTRVEFATRSCIADITGDGTIDLDDFFAFFNCWDASSPCADLDGVPGVDLGDFFAFFNAFDTNC